MNSIGVWLISILSSIIISIIIDLIMSNSRMYKFVKALSNTIMILIIVSPLPMILNGNFDIKQQLLETELDNNYMQYTNRVKFEYMEKGLKETLRNEGIYNFDIEIQGHDEKGHIIVEKVLVNIKNIVIDEKYKHINKYELMKNKLSKYLSISEECIKIEG